ncbi:MAG: sigma-70 family RNA polymerase sigma factor [Candidatus Latescibacterota bacterium]|jgi:RNA polymerase sigma-70 factor (ECF subfamily)
MADTGIEAGLIQRCVQGDETAWRWLIGQYRERLFRVAMGLLGHPSEAEEATQETFVQVFRHLAGFQGGSSLYTWACRICINLCLRRRERVRRTQQREVSLDSDEGIKRAAVVPGTPTPEDALLEEELSSHLHQALRRLPIEFQAALVLREIDGLSYEEIAQALGVSLGTVKSRVHRGRLILKERVKEYLEGAAYAS